MSERVSGEPFRKFGDLSPLSESLIPCMDRDWKDPLRRFRDFSENDLGFLVRGAKTVTFGHSATSGSRGDKIFLLTTQPEYE